MSVPTVSTPAFLTLAGSSDAADDAANDGVCAKASAPATTTAANAYFFVDFTDSPLMGEDPNLTHAQDWGCSPGRGILSPLKSRLGHRVMPFIRGTEESPDSAEQSDG